MNVKLISHTINAMNVLFVAARTCYSSTTAGEIANTHDGYTPEKMLGVVRGCIKRGHNSVIRHVSFTFTIDGISRACANQLTRHGPGWAFDQQSLRYVQLADQPEWVIPVSLRHDEAKWLKLTAGSAWAEYWRMVNEGIPKEDARAVLPLCTPTNLVATANLAALMHFYGVRFRGDTGKPQDEIRRLAAEMIRLVVIAEPWLGEFFPDVTP